MFHHYRRAVLLAALSSLTVYSASVSTVTKLREAYGKCRDPESRGKVMTELFMRHILVDVFNPKSDEVLLSFDTLFFKEKGEEDSFIKDKVRKNLGKLKKRLNKIITESCCSSGISVSYDTMCGSIAAKLYCAPRPGGSYDILNHILRFAPESKEHGFLSTIPKPKVLYHRVVASRNTTVTLEARLAWDSYYHALKDALTRCGVTYYEERPLYRGLRNATVEKLYGDIKKGTLITHMEFTSTSLDKNEASNFMGGRNKVFIIIRKGRGVKVADVSVGIHEGEAEVILLPGTVWKVIDITKSAKSNGVIQETLEVEMIIPDTPTSSSAAQAVLDARKKSGDNPVSPQLQALAVATGAATPKPVYPPQDLVERKPVPPDPICIVGIGIVLLYMLCILVCLWRSIT